MQIILLIIFQLFFFYIFFSLYIQYQLKILHYLQTQGNDYFNEHIYKYY